MRVETTNIERLPDHTYYHETIGIANSVTTIIKKGNSFLGNKQAMDKGTLMHQALEVFFKGKKEDFKTVYNELDDELQTKVRSIVEFIKQEKLKTEYSEKPFIAKDDEAKFGGTIDLLCSNLVIDYKSGNVFNNNSINKNYLEQISTYAKAMNKKEALLLYFDNGNLKNFAINQEVIDQQYSNFKAKALVFTNQLTDFDRDMLDEFKKYASLNNEMKEIELKIDELKANLENKIKANKLTKYGVEQFLIYEVTGKTTKNLKKDIKEKLLAEHEEYFNIKDSKPYFTIRGA